MLMLQKIMTSIIKVIFCSEGGLILKEIILNEVESEMYFQIVNIYNFAKFI